MKKRYNEYHEGFWARVDVRQPHECWPWKGAVRTDGYGRFAVHRRSISAHRLAYTLKNGPARPSHH